MFRLLVRGLPVALATAVLAPPSLAADPPRPQPRGSAVGTLAPEALATALRAEQDAYLRRLEVCGRLRQVAAQSNNDALYAQADRLEQEAKTLYDERVARFGVRGGPTPATRTATASLDATLGTGAATNPLAANKPTDSGKAASARARTFREVNP